MRNFLLSILFLSLTTSLSAQSSDGFEEFFAKFQTALKTKNKTAVADMTAFPLFSPDFNGTIRSRKDTVDEITREVFLKHYSALIKPKMIAQLAKEKHTKTELYGEESNCYAVVYWRDKSGAAWFTFCKGLEDGVWKWVGTDNVSM